MAEIKQLYSDAARTKPIYPKTVGSAVDLGGGKSFQDFMSVVVTLTAEGWSSSAPYTQIVGVANMTADWVPGIPTVVLASSVEVTDLLAATEALGCIKMVASAAGTLTFTAPEEKPGVSLTLRVPGMVERS